MRIRAAITVALAALAVAVLMAMPAFAAKGGTDRPYKLSATQTGTITFDADFNTLSYKLVGPGIASHLGKVTLEATNGSGDFRNEVDTSTAANGDKLFASIKSQTNLGPSCPDVPDFNFNAGPFTQTIDYKGGTGRFANASGTSVAVGCIYFDFSDFTDLEFPFYATSTETGTLTY